MIKVDPNHKYAKFPNWVGFFGFAAYPIFFKDYQQVYYDIQEGYRSEELREEFEALRRDRTFGRALLMFTLPTFLFMLACTVAAVFFKLCGLLILWLFLRWLYEPGAENYWGYVFSILSCIATLAYGAFDHWKIWGIVKMGYRMQVAIVFGIYEVLLKNCNSVTSGEVSNLMGGHLQAIIDVMPLIPLGMIAPFEVMALTGVLAWFIRSWVAVLPVCLWLACAFAVLIVGAFFGNAHAQYIASQDERVKYTSQFLFSIRTVKMCAWEKHFVDNINAQRSKEMSLMWQEGICRSLMIFLNNSGGTVCLIVTLIVITVTEPNIESFLLFTLLFILTAFQTAFQSSADFIMCLGVILPSATTMLKFINVASIPRNTIDYGDGASAISAGNANGEGGVSMVLLDSSNSGGKQSRFDVGGNGQLRLAIENAEFSYNEGDPRALRNIDLTVYDREKVFVIGSVGCGKSSILKSFIPNSLIRHSGNVKVRGSIAYLSQAAWIFNGTVKENILFGKPYDEDLFSRVVFAACLEADIKTWTEGVETSLGARGINISGGQKQRISLARGLYSQKDIYLCDDPLSAVDPGVMHFIYREAIFHFLKEKTVLFVTNQMYYLPLASRCLLMDGGAVVCQGTYQECCNNPQFTAFTNTKVSKVTAIDDTEERKREKQEEKAKGALVEKQEEQLGESETLREATISLKRYWKTALKGGIYHILIACIFFSFSSAIAIISIWWILQWATDIIKHNPTLAAANNLTFINGTVDNIYWVMTFAAFKFSDCICVLIGTVLVACFFSLNISIRVHKDAIRHLKRSTIFFFDHTSAGTILSRLTNELFQVDVNLPFSLALMFTLNFNVLTALAGIGMGAWYALIMILPLLVLTYGLSFYFVRPKYIQAERQDVLARDGLTTHVTASLDGVDTILAYGEQEQMRMRLIALLDNSARWRQMSFVVNIFNRTMGITLTAVMQFIVLMSITIVYQFFPYALGQYPFVALSFAINLPIAIKEGGNNIIYSETRLLVIENLFQFKKIEKEINYEDTPDIPNWPSDGSIAFQDLSFRYKRGPLVLKNLNIQIKSEEKIGIVGRTGAGKSSILQALLRMFEPETGTVMISGVDYRKIALKQLRSSIAIIAQDPTLFIGTIRYNMDPQGVFTDEKIWHCLKIVNLDEKIRSFAKQLDEEVAENGANLSLGERQLFCFARAVLMDKKIILLDEATANIDPGTDAIIQNVVENIFQHQTVLIIAHRIQTILHCDKILVLDKGSVVEFDSPQNLLDNPNSFFSKFSVGTASKNNQREQEKAEEI